jgi:hypothetical protein
LLLVVIGAKRGRNVVHKDRTQRGRSTNKGGEITKERDQLKF